MQCSILLSPCALQETPDDLSKSQEIGDTLQYSIKSIVSARRTLHLGFRTF